MLRASGRPYTRYEPPGDVHARLVLAALPVAAKRMMLRKKAEREGGGKHGGLKAACLADVGLFAREFFPEWARDEFSGMHREFFTEYREEQGKRGVRRVIAAPRGSAKTTIRTIIKTAHDCVYQLERFVMIGSHTQDLAREKVQAVRDALGQNARLREVYGDQVGVRWNQDDFTTRRGVRVLAISPGAQVRGRIKEGQRPTKIVLDDVEHPEHVVSALQRERMANWLVQDVSKLGDATTNLEVVGTVLHPEILLVGLLGNPGYRGSVYRSVLRYNEAVGDWQAWRAIVTDLGNPHRLSDARAYYDARPAMQDAEVLWPERESYYDLMLARVVEGEPAFQLEKQNNATPTGLYMFNMEAARYVRVEPGGLRRSDGRELDWSEVVEVSAAWDPSMGGGREGDWSCCVIGGIDRDGYLYLVDAYVAQHATPDVQVAGIVDLLWQWRPDRFGIEANGFQNLLVKDVQEQLAARVVEAGEVWSPALVPIVNTAQKARRIATLQPMVANGWLQFSEALPRELLRQFAEFRPVEGAGHDDAPDASELCVRLLRHVV